MGGYADHRKDTEVNNKVLMTNKAIITIKIKTRELLAEKAPKAYHTKSSH